MFARFSTVAGGSGSVDTPRDVRGFAVKFYTNAGNWDLVGNNIPVFFIQDAIKFPDLIHAVKMEPDRGFPQAATAHDNFWDFISLTPEAMHMVMWAMSDRTLPRSLRMMEGFGIHTFRLVNASGASTFVKFHWRPKLGLQSTIWDEAVKLAGADPDFHRRDLFEAIQNGDFPEWQLAVQLFTQEEADKFPFDHLDPTKLIPEELVPLTVIGRMVLDRWPDNFFAETEQVAFCPSHIVPGIDFSNDPLLQGRLFSYLDTQLSRLGSANFHQLPINAPKCPFANQQRDGHMQMNVPKGRVNYEPSSLDARSPRESAAGFRSAAVAADDGEKGRVRASSFADHYSQARMFYRSQTEYRAGAHRLGPGLRTFKSGNRACAPCHAGTSAQRGQQAGRPCRQGLGVDRLPAAAPTPTAIRNFPPSPALQIIGKMPETLQGRTVGFLIADGTEADVIAILRKSVEREGARVKIVASTLAGARLSNGKMLAADGQLAGTPSVIFDAIVLALSSDAGKAMAKDASAVDFVRDAFGHLKAIAVTAGAQPLLKAAGVLKDPGVVDAADFKGFVRAARKRQWPRERGVRTLW